MMKDPAELSKGDCQTQLSAVMQESAKLHQILLDALKVSSGQMTPPEMLQCAEVTNFLVQYDTMKVFQLEPRSA